MSTIYICGYLNFPRGSASANYIQYLSMLFHEIGYKVVIISDINKDEMHLNDNFVNRNKDWLELKEVVSFQHNANILIRHINVLFYEPRGLINKLSEYDLKQGDIIFAYTSNTFIHRAMQKFAKDKDVYAGASVVEWFPRTMYNKWLINIDYWKTFINFKWILKRYDFLFPISSFINDHFKKFGSKTMCLPILTDPFEFKYLPKSNSGKVKIIYSGNGKIKDDIESLLKGFMLLDSKFKEKIELHLCGVTKKYASQIMSAEYLSSKSIVFHDWMKYEELIELYQNTDFLMLPRKLNQMTRANFPSKVPETMCYGIIPIASDVGDYTRLYLKDGENSIIMHGSSPALCKEALEKAALMNTKERKRMEENARSTSIEIFYYLNWKTKVYDFLNEIEYGSV